MGGFTNWVEDIAESRGKLDYRRRVPEHETVSTWQSLSFGPNYKAAYCISVCPAGEEVIGPFRLSRKAFTEDVVRPLQAKVEDLYVIQGSDAETHARRRFPHKRIRHVRNPLRPRNIATFLQGLPLAFQRGAAGSLRARYHFRFTGEEKADVTVRIHDGKLDVSPGLEGTPDIRVTADGGTWLGFLAGERGLPWALLTGRIRLKGDPRWLLAFRKCFPV